MHLAATSLVRDIAQLDRKRLYPYVNSSNSGRIRILEVVLPHGPIRFKRFNPSKGKRQNEAKCQSISESSILTVANALSSGRPVCLDSVLLGSGNNRAVFESLLAHTPSVYVCRPDKIFSGSVGDELRRGVKHIVRRPDGIHPPGLVTECETDIVISEFAASNEVHHRRLSFPEHSPGNGILLPPDLDMTRHAQMQLSLLLIGDAMGFRNWIAKNDQGISDGDGRFGDHPSVIGSLDEQRLLNADAVNAGMHLDCAWFTRDFTDIPAVFEIEHSTRITSGLTRMKGFKDTAPKLAIRWVVVARESDREKVIQIANREQFRDLKAKFLSYESVDELRSIRDRKGLRGTNAEFMDNWLTECVAG